jgi:hypothetical protein
MSHPGIDVKLKEKKRKKSVTSPPAIMFFQFSDTKSLEGFSEEIGKIVEFTPEQTFFPKAFPNFPKKQKHLRKNIH